LSDLYDVILFPKLKEGADPATVKARLAKLLKIDEAKAGALVDSGKNTRLFRALEKGQADKYIKAISACGITCNLAPSAGKSLAELAGTGGGEGAGGDGKADGGGGGGGAGGLALVPMTEGMRTFKCPKCDHTEEIPRAQKIEICPSCNANVKKALERQQKEEDELRLKQSRAAAEKRRLKEYEEKLRIELEKQIRARLEEEIRKEMGLTEGAATGFWGLFMRNKAVMMVSVFGSLIAVTIALTLFFKNYLDEQEREAIATEPPTPEMEAVAPAMAAAVTATIQSPQMEESVQVMAQAVNQMAPPAQQVDMQAMAAAGVTMMKGLDPGAFMAMAATTQMLGQAMGPLAAMGGLPAGGGAAGMAAMAGMSGGAPPMMMGMPGVANQLGMPGMGQIPKEDFVAMLTGQGAPGMGQQTVMGMVSGNPLFMGQMPVLDGVEAPRLEVMTPTEAAVVVDALSDDREWGRFVATRVGALAAVDPDAANALATLIETPFERAIARARIAVALQETGLDAAARQMATRALDELDELEHVDTRAQAAVAVGNLLFRAGQEAVPGDVRGRLQAAADRSLIAEDKAALLGRVAVSHYFDGNLEAANTLIEQAMEAAGGLQLDALRLETFLGIAQRYADMSATPVAHTIANEAVARGRNLATADRVRVFVTSAKARAYMGDTERAARDLNLVGEEVARDQALTAVIEHLITANEPYRAAQFIDAVEDIELAVQLNLDLVAQSLSDNSAPIVTQRIDHAEQLMVALEDPETRALMHSRLARLQVRVGRAVDAARNFQLALEGTRIARVESRDLMLASIATDQAFALDLEAAQATNNLIGESLLRERVNELLLSVDDVRANPGLEDPSYVLPEREEGEPGGTPSPGTPPDRAQPG
jgi:hypothetical protein